MGTPLASAFVEISADDKKFLKTFKKVESKIKELSGVLKTMNTSINKTFGNTANVRKFDSGLKSVTNSITKSSTELGKFTGKTKGLGTTFRALNTAVNKTFTNTQKIQLFAKNLNRVAEAVKKSSNKMGGFAQKTAGLGKTFTGLNRALNGTVTNTQKVMAFATGMNKIAQAFRNVNPEFAKFAQSAKLMTKSLNQATGSTTASSRILKAYSGTLTKVTALEKRLSAQNQKTGKSFQFLGLGAKKAQGNMRSLNSSMLSFGNVIKTYAGIKAFQGLYDMVAGFTSFEQEIINAKVDLGLFAKEGTEKFDIVAKQFDKLTKKGIELGKATIFSSTEVAGAMDMLAKNGITYNQIMDGAIDSTLDLAAATGSDLKLSADVATDAMIIFGKEAKDLDKVVDGITGVVLNSKYNLQGYADALHNVGAVAADIHIPLEDVNTVIAMTAPGFKSGRDAGTSFKTFLTRLVPTTKKQIDAFKELGFIVDNENLFYDKGKLKTQREQIDLISTALKGMGDEMKGAQLKAAFGTEGIRHMTSIAAGGVRMFDLMKKRIGDVVAMDVAIEKTNTVSGQLKILGAVISSVITDAILPFNGSMKDTAKYLNHFFTELGKTKGFKNFANGVAEVIKLLWEVGKTFVIVFSKQIKKGFADTGIEGMNDKWITLKESIIDFTVIFAKVLASAITLGVKLFTGMSKTMNRFSRSLGANKDFILKMAGGFLVVKAALSLFGLKIASIIPLIGGLTKAIGFLFANPVVLAAIGVMITTIGLLGISIVKTSDKTQDEMNILEKFFDNLGTDLANIFDRMWTALSNGFKTWKANFLSEWKILAKAMEVLSSDLAQVLLSIFIPVYGAYKLIKKGINLVKGVKEVETKIVTETRGGVEEGFMGPNQPFIGPLKPVDYDPNDYKIFGHLKDQFGELFNSSEDAKEGIEGLDDIEMPGLDLGQIDADAKELRDLMNDVEEAGNAAAKFEDEGYGESPDYDELAGGKDKALSTLELTGLLDRINNMYHIHRVDMQKEIQLYDNNITALGDNGEKIIDNFKYLASTLKNETVSLPKFSTTDWDKDTTQAFKNTQDSLKNVFSSLNDMGRAFQDALLDKSHPLAIDDLRNSVRELDKAIIYMKESVKQIEIAFDEVYNSLKDSLSGIRDEITAVDDQIAKMTGTYDYEIEAQKKTDEIDTAQQDLKIRKIEEEEAARLNLLEATKALDDARLRLLDDEVDPTVPANEIEIQKEKLALLKEEWELAKSIYAGDESSQAVKDAMEKVNALKKEKEYMEFIRRIEQEDTGELSKRQLKQYEDLTKVQQKQIDKKLELIRLEEVKAELQKKSEALELLMNRAREGQINVTKSGVVQATKRAEFSKKELQDMQDLYELVKQDPRLKQQLESLTITRNQMELEKESLETLQEKREYAYDLFKSYEEEINRIKNEQHQKDQDALDKLISKYEDLSTAQKKMIDDYVKHGNKGIAEIMDTWKNTMGQMGGRISGNVLGFKSGGFTGGDKLSKIAGVVHEGEYVIPNNVLKSIAPTGMLGTLEKLRKGFKDGGFTSPTTFNQPNNNTNVKIDVSQNITDGADAMAAAKELYYIFNSRLAI